MNDENELLAELSNYDDSIHDQLVDDKGFTNMAEETNTQQQKAPLPQLDAQGLAELQGNAAKAQGFLPDNPLQLLSEAGTALVGGTADAIDSVGSFGDLVGDKTGSDHNRYGITGFSNNTRGLFAGGYSPVRSTTIEFINIASKGDAIFFGELTQRRRDATSLASPTRGVIAGGLDSTNTQNIMDFVTISTSGNAIDFGDLVNSIIIGGTDYPSRHLAIPASSVTRGLIAGGYYFTDAIDLITIATTGDSTDFGNLPQSRAGGNGTSNSIRGVFGGGISPTYRDTIDFVTISSAGNATDFGNLASARHYLFNGQCADAHGGLGE